MISVTRRDFLAAPTDTDGSVGNGRRQFCIAKYIAWKVKAPHGPEICCGFTKRPLPGAQGRSRYAAAVLTKARNSKGRQRSIPVEVAYFDTRQEAANQALEWFRRRGGISELSRDGEPLSRTEAKVVARGLKARGLRVSLSLHCA